MIKRIQSGTLHVLFWTLLILTLGLSSVRFALSELHVFKATLEQQLSSQLGARVSIKKIQGVFNDFTPKLALQDIQIHAQQGEATDLRLQEILLGLDLFAALQHSLLKAVQVTLIGAKLSVKRLASGNIAIIGLPNSDDRQQPTWLLQGKQYQLIDSDILWQDEKRNAQPIPLRHVNISIYNNQRHKIFIDMDLPDTLGQSLELAMDFSGSMFIPQGVDARLFVQGKNINLAKIITGDLPFDFTITQGHGDFAIWSSWQATQMTGMSGSVNIHDTILKDQQKHTLPIDQLDLQFKLQKQQQQWQLALQNTTLSSQQITADIAQLALALEQDEQGELTQFALNCPQLDIGSLSNIITANKAFPQELQQHLQALAIEGHAKDLLFLANIPEQTFAINAQLNKIKFAATEELPGLKGLSLYIKGTEQQGDIRLSAPTLKFTSPTLFRQPVYFKQALGALHWQQTDDKWILSSPLLALNSAAFKTDNAFKLTLPKNDQAIDMDLRSNFTIYDAAQTPHYLPVGVIDDALVEWLDHAFLAGHANGGILFRGALNDYPFTQPTGVFEILFDVHDVTLHYADDWPQLDALDAELRFFAESLEVNVHHGLAEQANIQQAKVTIDSFTFSDYLNIQGQADGELTQAIRFLQHSPFHQEVNTVTELLKAQGSLNTHIDLKIPLTDTVSTKIDISAETQNASLHIIPADLTLSNLNAEFQITEKTISSQQLNAQTLGFPVYAKLNYSQENTRVFISGKTDSQHLAQQFPHPLWAQTEGISNYQVQLNIPTDSTKSSHIQLNSELTGIAIDFPPFSKPATQAHPLALEMYIKPSGIEAFNFNYDNRLAPNDSLDIQLKKIAPHWQGLIHSPIASGSLFIPTEFNKNTGMSLILNKLDLSVLTDMQLTGASSAFAIADFPSINLVSQNLYWQGMNLGKLELLTQPEDQGLFIQQLNITAPDRTLDLSGHWQQKQAKNFSSINGTFHDRDFGHFLQKTQLSSDLIDTTADLQFSLNWPDAPYKISLTSLSGSINTHLTNGRILGVDPGLGRILGALDIWKLGQRLQFDFSDITEDGLSFSDINSTLALNQGLLSTDKLHINAMPAEIYIKGSTHLATKQIDLQATVLPKFPIAGTMIGNVANKVTKTFIGDEHAGGLLLSLLYEIKGSWEKFTVNRQFNPGLLPKNTLDQKP